MGKIPNIMTAKYQDIIEYFKDNDCLQNLSNDTMCVVSLRNLPYIGRTEFSDIIIIYDPNTYKPMIVTERLYRKFYNSDADYRGACEQILEYMQMATHDEFGFTFKDPTTSRDKNGFRFKKASTEDYFEFTRYKAEVWQCVKLRES